MIRINLNPLFALLVFVSVFLEAEPLFSSEVNPRGNVAIFSSAGNDLQISAVVDETVKQVEAVFDALGRFRAVDRKTSDSELRDVADLPGDPYMNAARKLAVEAYILLDCFRRGDVIYAEIKFKGISDHYKPLSRTILVRTKIPVNLPVKAAKEIARIHEYIPVYSDIVFMGAGVYLISCGQWNGIKPGRYVIDENEEMEVFQTGRFYSYARFTSRFIQKKSITVYVYPDIKSEAARLEALLDENTINRYGLGSTLIRGADPEKRFIESTCIINPGANICLPGYGAFLATGYMGFQQESPSMAGVVFSTSLLVTHFTLTEFLTGFKTSFFPWENDSSRSQGMTRLHSFLWITVPLTMTAAYFDQMAYQYSKSGNLPPFFNTRDEAGAAFSLLFPGGGMFYKGYRGTGWFFYLSEMSLAGYASYHYTDGSKFAYSMYALAIIKIIDIVGAYFLSPSFDTYNFEKEGDIIRVIPKFSYDAPARERTYSVELSFTL